MWSYSSGDFQPPGTFNGGWEATATIHLRIQAERNGDGLADVADRASKGIFGESDDDAFHRRPSTTRLASFCYSFSRRLGKPVADLGYKPTTGKGGTSLCLGIENC